MTNTFSSNIKRIRLERGLSQEQMAEILGTTKQVLSRYETNQRTPKITTVAAYAKRLGISIGELSGYEEKPATSDGDGLELTEEEHEHIRLLRAASPELQAAALAMLEAADKARLVQDSSEEDK